MRKLAIFSAAFAAAAAISVILLPDIRVFWAVFGCLGLAWAARRFGFLRTGIVLLGLAVGLVWCYGYRTVKLAPAERASGTQQQITLTVQEKPVPTNYGLRISGTVRLENRRYFSTLYAEQTDAEILPGSRVSCLAEITPSGMELSDGESLYLRSQGIVLCLYGRSPLEITPGKAALPQRLRMWLQERIAALYDGDAESLVQALLTGDRSGMSFTVQSHLSAAGLSHAVAVSGMHVSMLLLVVSVLTLGNPRLVALLGVPLLVFFALVTGASPSVCRACMMHILILCAPLLQREHDPATSMGASALVLLLENPWSIASVSFQLSFCAVAGLFTLSGPIQKKLLSLQKKPGKLLRFAASGASATLAATAATLPLSVFYFGQLSLAAPLTNLLALWAVTGIFVLGLFSCCLGPVGPVLAWAAGLLSDYVLLICRWTAAWPYAAASTQYPPLLIWAVLAYAAAAILLLLKGKFPAAISLCVMTAAFLGCVLFGRWSVTLKPWSFTALDVGQGQCLIYRSGDYTAVIDCGSAFRDDAGEDAVRRLHSAGITRVDGLILTHFDHDHCGGAVHLTQRLDVEQVFLPNRPDPTGVREALEASGASVHYVENVIRIELAQGEITLYPPLSGENDNNAGVCVLATTQEYDILVTGDLDEMAEMRLLSAYALPEVELLVAGHHGAGNSTSQVLLDTVRPETVVISVGENSYGHPADRTLERIAGAGARILRTDETGTVRITP